MKTVPFSDILAQVCQLVGLDRITLNDKSFGAVRDMVNRRIGTIWDREEWPDTERRINTYPGLPVTSVSRVDESILLENGQSLMTESSSNIWTNNADNTVGINIVFDLNFPRIYLEDFENNHYKLGTIGDTYVKFVNPFFYITAEGERVSISKDQYNFTYEYESGEFGHYIKSITITLPDSYPEYFDYAGPNGQLTTKVVFTSNKQLLVQLEPGAMQGLEAFDNDPRKTSRTKFQDFVVEDFDGINDSAFGGSIYSKEYTYLRFFSDSQKFIKYRQPCAVIFGLSYDPLLEYSSGSQAYFDPIQNSANYYPSVKNAGVSGNFWKAVKTAFAGNRPSNVNASWELVSIPYRFKDYLINGASADFLRSEGRADEANILDQLAETAVQQQIDVLIRQQGQVQKMNMVYTY
jgi:hypothetical protein